MEYPRSAKAYSTQLRKDEGSHISHHCELMMRIRLCEYHYHINAHSELDLYALSLSVTKAVIKPIHHMGVMKQLYEQSSKA